MVYIYIYSLQVKAPFLPVGVKATKFYNRSFFRAPGDELLGGNALEWQAKKGIAGGGEVPEIDIFQGFEPGKTLGDTKTFTGFYLLVGYNL